MSKRWILFGSAVLTALVLGLVPAFVLASAPTQVRDTDTEMELAAQSGTGVAVTGMARIDADVREVDTAAVGLLQAVAVSKMADPTSLPEPGGTVTFTVGVTNTGVETVTLISLLDVPYGNLADPGNAAISNSTCITGGTIAPSGGVYTCTFEADVSGEPGVHTDTVTTTVEADVGQRVSANAGASVTITDVRPTLDVSKIADPATLPEPGGTVTFTVGVTNTSVETVTLISLMDMPYGDLADPGNTVISNSTCITGGMIAPDSGVYTCTFQADVSGEPGVHADTVTATVEDNENNTAVVSDDATVTLTDVASSIEVDKTADPTTVPEPGGAVTFTVRVTNTSAVDSVTIDVLTDTVHGDLTAVPGSTCSVSQDLGPGAWYACQFSATVSGNAGEEETDEVTASGVDDDGGTVEASDNATVTVNDVASSIEVDKTADPTTVPEPGGAVTFTVRVTNTSAVDSVTIDVLTDTVHGDLTAVPGSTCSVSQDLGPGAWYACQFSATVSGNAGDEETDEVTASGVDDDGGTVEASDNATVTVTDVASSIEVDKTADPTTVPEPGGAVTFTVRVTNTSAVDSVTIDVLTDTVHGDLTAVPGSTCSVPQDLGPGAWYACQFSATVSGNAGEEETDEVTASGVDDDGNAVAASDDATVIITDVPSSIAVDKVADPTTVPEPGGAVTFTVRVTNTSAVDSVTIEALTDTVHGDLTTVPGSTCSVPQALDSGAWYTCQFSAIVSGNAGDEETDEVTASGVDDDGGPVEASDDATVTVTDVQPTIEVSKTADPTIIRAGDLVEFTIRVDNYSVEQVTLVDLDDTVFGDLTTECGLPANIAVDEFLECVISRTISADHTNTVTATARDDEDNTATDSADASVDVIGPSIQVVKRASVTNAVVGETITYTYTVENVGDVTLIDVHASDDRLGAIELGSTTLASGEVTTGTAAHLVDEGDLPGPLTNTATVTGTPSVGAVVIGTDTATVDVEPAIKTVYLPSVLKRAAPPAPDLVVEHIAVTSGSARVVIKNQGDAPVLARDAFWVDLYVDPDPAPTGVNQLWYQLCSQGIAWGVEGASALPLGPGGTITLTIGDGYYYPGDSNFPGSLPAGTPIYVQVDSYGGEPYGLVLESHEITGGHYNNISGPVFSTLGAIGAEPVVELPVIRDRPPGSSGRLPPRP